MLRLVCDFLKDNKIEHKCCADLSVISSVRIGGVADVLITPSSAEELKLLTDFFNKHNIPKIILGRASNVLFVKDIISCPVIQTVRLAGVIFDGEYVFAECGVSLSRLAHLAAERGYSGLEELSGIPGTVGGALVGNAGAFGKDISSVVSEVSVIGQNGLFQIVYNNDACEFSYRNSRFSHSGEVVLACKMKLKPEQPRLIKEKMDLFLQKRLESQPHGVPSLGSVFKRPVRGYAGEMIERCGLKGHVIGGAAISEAHAGFIVNLGGATAADYTALYYLAKKAVFEKFSVILEPEIRFV